LSSEELLSMAWPIAKPLLMEHQEHAVRGYSQCSSNQQTTHDVKQIGMKARQGAVETLFVALNQEVWGKPKVRTSDVEIHETRQPGDRDLLDFAATETFLHGGEVYAVGQQHMPVSSPAAAMLRF
jgi:hypothetical protein